MFPGHFTKALFTQMEIFNKAILTFGFGEQGITWENQTEVFLFPEHRLCLK